MDPFPDSTMDTFFQMMPEDLPMLWPPSQFPQEEASAAASVYPSQPQTTIPFMDIAQESVFDSSLFSSSVVSPIPVPDIQPGQPTESVFPVLDEQGQPIKARRKPGRKPNPASPALRKAQNRAAQRAFRVRKERHLRELENTVKILREQRHSLVKELGVKKKKLDEYKAENWYLKGVVLTLQFVCMYHNIHIPTHSPYLTEQTLQEMAKTAPHAIEAYVNAYTRNNLNLKTTMAAHFANITSSNPVKAESTDNNVERDEHGNLYGALDNNQESGASTFPSRLDSEGLDAMDMGNLDSPAIPQFLKQEMDQDTDMSQLLQDEHASTPDKKAEQESEENSLSAIQRIRLQLRIQCALTSNEASADRLQPTLLQLAIPHDPRIDLIPTPHMRDRLIIFRDQVDYDACFTTLVNGSVYHGGDPTQSDSWELPAEFFSEYWFLAIAYDVKKTNKWRKLKGLPEIKTGPTVEDQPQPTGFCMYQPQQTADQPTESPNWADDILAQFSEGMPTLQPFDMNSPCAQNSSTSEYTNDVQVHPLYKRYLRSPPGTERPVRSASVNAFINFVESFTAESNL